MTRRIITFYDHKTQKLYKSPEFNGDRFEFQTLGQLDSCLMKWKEIEALFSNTTDEESFNAASMKAQNQYISHFTDTVCLSPIKEIGFSEFYHLLNQYGNNLIAI